MSQRWGETGRQMIRENPARVGTVGKGPDSYG